MPALPSIPPAPDLAAPSPITTLPPFSGIHNSSTVFHFPEACSAGPGLWLWLAQVTEEKRRKRRVVVVVEEAIALFIDMQQTAVVEQRPLSIY